MNFRPTLEAQPGRGVVGEMSVQYGTEQLFLIAERAVFLPEHRALCITDPHFGKEYSAQQLGIAVPVGTLEGDLQRIFNLIVRYEARSLAILGDLFHDEQGTPPELIERLRHFFSSLPFASPTTTEHSERVILILGNHDRKVRAQIEKLGISPEEEPFHLGPFSLCHLLERDGERPVLRGHEHPGTTLRGLGRERLRLPCFLLEENSITLPAFGALTGMHEAKSARTTGVVAISEGRLFPVPSFSVL
ncbi:ligase-associated DNA damage response endonuclease PdeM [bacterium]|nr:ligase-associated DNA damage response endonuclease PdeM [bacterium]